MQKPIGYDQTEAKQFNANNKPPAGAYVMRIENAVETKANNGRPMMVFLLEIAQGEHAGNFRKLWEYLKKNNAEAKWPCVHRRCVDGESVPYFKGDIKAIEESNQGFVFNWDEKTLKNKLVGCMLREKAIGENQDGSVKTILEPAFLCSVKTATSGELKPMPIKFDKQQQNTSNNDPELSDAMPF